MDDAERAARVAVTEARLKAMRDAIPEGPGLQLSERELIAVALIVGRCAEYEREDIIGAFLKTSGGTVLDSKEIVDLSAKFEAAIERFQPLRSQR